MRQENKGGKGIFLGFLQDLEKGKTKKKNQLTQDGTRNDGNLQAFVPYSPWFSVPSEYEDNPN